MNIFDIIILATIALLLYLALRKVKKSGGCACSGNCGSCNGCSACKSK